MKITQSITLDFARSTMPVTVFAKQYDADTREIVITPLNNGAPYTLESGITARLQMTKNDGTTVINNATISSNTITVTLTAQALTAAGTAVAEIGLYKNSTLLSSQIFYIDVQKGAYDENAVKSSDEYGALVTALAQADAATSAATEASATATSAAQAAANAATRAETAYTNSQTALTAANAALAEAQRITGDLQTALEEARYGHSE